MNLESIHQRTTRYVGYDRRQRAALLWSDYIALRSMIEKREKLVLHMLNTIDHPGRDRMAMIDARQWHEYYTKRIRRMGIGKPPRGKSPMKIPIDR